MALLRMIVTNEARSFVLFCAYKILPRKGRVHLDIKIFEFVNHVKVSIQGKYTKIDKSSTAFRLNE